MKKKRSVLRGLIALALPLALLLTGCTESPGEEAPVEGAIGTIIGTPLSEKQVADELFSLSYAPEGSLNPYFNVNSVNSQLAGLLYEGLFTVGQDFSFAPTRLISGYETSDGGKTWVFTVNDAVRFSNGNPLTARDAAYSIRSAMQSNLYRERLNNYTVLFGISALSDTQFMVTLYQENMLFPALLTIPVLPYDSLRSPCPPGTGLYRMEGSELWLGSPEPEEPEAPEEGERPEEPPAPIVPKLVLNPFHPDAARASLEEICLRPYQGMEDCLSAFEDGLVDLLQNDPTGISAVGHSSSNEVRSYIYPSMYYVGFNMNRDFVQVAQYRYAMTYLMDRNTIVNKIMGGNGVAAVSPFVPGSLYYDDALENAVHYAPQVALDTLARGGCADHDEDGKLEFMVTGIPMEIKLDLVACSSSTVKVSVAYSIVETFREAGITVNLRELSYKDYLAALEKGDFDMYLGEVILSADFNLSPLLTEEGSLNFGGVKDPGYASRIAAFLAADDANRRARCSELCQYIAANSPIIPLAFESRDVITHRGIVSGAELSPYNIFYNFADWKFKSPEGAHAPRG